MSKEKKYVLMEEEALREQIRKHYQCGYMVVLLSHICLKNRLDTHLKIMEACSVLELSPRQVEEERRKYQMRTINTGRGILYSAYDLAMLAARLRAKRKMSGMHNIPKYVLKPE